MTIGDTLMYKEETNKQSIRTMNIIAEKTCSNCIDNKQCKKNSKNDSCWNYRETYDETD